MYMAHGTLAPIVDSSRLSATHVPREEYDDLKIRYDALVASRSAAGGSSKRGPRARQSTVLAEIEPGEDRSRQGSEETSTRKKRSLRLEVYTLPPSFKPLTDGLTASRTSNGEQAIGRRVQYIQV